MTISAESLFSDLASDGPPLFFPDPPAPVTFNFDQGIAAEETFPIEDLRELANRVLDRDGARALEYISFDYDEDADQIIYLPSYIELVLGYTGLREQIAAWLAKKNDRPDLVADGVILTSGSVQAISMAFQAFINPGEGALVESATFPYALRYLEMRGADVRTVALDGDGVDVDAMERRLKEFHADGVKPKFMYTIPTFQLPTCVVTPLDRRKRMLELAEEWDLVILEDNVYGDLRYEGKPIPTLLSLDTSGRVMQSHSFSKILAPGIRLGWIAGQPEMVAGLAAVRQDLGVSQWFARMMTEYMAEDKLDGQIERANAVYRKKRDIAVHAVREHCAEWVTFDVPKGGYYLWLEISSEVDWDKAQQAAANAGVFCRPGEAFMDAEDGKRFLRLAYSHAPEHELERGIAALGEAIRGAVA